MEISEFSYMENQDTRDFAIVGVHQGRVVLEANEWDLSMGVYRVVTLYLNPANAMRLADQLVSCASGATPDGATAH